MPRTGKMHRYAIITTLLISTALIGCAEPRHGVTAGDTHSVSSTPGGLPTTPTDPPTTPTDPPTTPTDPPTTPTDPPTTPTDPPTQAVCQIVEQQYTNETLSLTISTAFDIDGKLDSQRQTAPNGELISETRYRPDGQVLSIETQTTLTTYSYDAAGRYLGGQTVGADGEVIAKTTVTYHGETKQRSTQLIEQFGSSPSREYWTYRDDGEPLLHQQNRNPDDGVIELDEQWTYTASGKLLGLQSINTQFPESSKVLTRRYDDQERVIEETVDRGNNGTINAITTWKYNTDGSYEQRIDTNGDGVPNHLSLYDAKQRLIALLTDENNDGTPNSYTVWTYVDDALVSSTSTTYDLAGNPTRVITDDYAGQRLVKKSEDTDGDGTIDQVTVYVHDAAGNVTSLLTTKNGAPIYSQMAWYDDQGHRTRWEIDSDPQRPGPETIVITTYNAEGKPTSVSTDADPDTPGLTQLTTLVYDAAGRLISRSDDYDDDGKAERLYQWSYDAHGQLLSERKDENGDGVAETSRSLSYTPTCATLAKP